MFEKINKDDRLVSSYQHLLALQIKLMEDSVSERLSEVMKKPMGATSLKDYKVKTTKEFLNEHRQSVMAGVYDKNDFVIIVFPSDLVSTSVRETMGYAESIAEDASSQIEKMIFSEYVSPIVDRLMHESSTEPYAHSGLVKADKIAYSESVKGISYTLSVYDYEQEYLAEVFISQTFFETSKNDEESDVSSLKVFLSAEIPVTKMDVGTVESISVGDEIPIPNASHVVLKDSSGEVLMDGELGSIEEQRSVKINEIKGQDDD